MKTKYGFHTSEVRSRTMSKIKGKNTKSELILRKELWRRGYRYRINVKTITGSPDIAIKKYKLAIFVDGEFWHGYNWETKKDKIKNNRDYWIPKIEKNIKRDKEINQALKNDGWTVIRFWEQEVLNSLNECLKKIIPHCQSDKQMAIPYE